jgi:hypothetical protein
MVKILGAAAAAIVIALAGFFGFQFYTQHRIAGQIESALEQIRAAGGKASHGKVSFDLLSRTVTVADIATQTAAEPPVSVKIASIIASGVSQPDTARFSADNIAAVDVEVGAAMGLQPGSSLTYKAPRIIVKDFSGPAGPQQRPPSSSASESYRFAIEQFAAINAASISIPSIAGTMTSGAALQDGNFTYSGVEAQGIKDGKIATTKVNGFSFTATTLEKGKARKIAGDLTNLVMLDFDATVIAATLDPQRVNDDRYYRVYRQFSAGSYVITPGQGMRMRIEGLTGDDVGLRPSRIKLPDLLAMMPQAGTTPTPAQARDMLEKVAGFYEGIRVGNAEARGISMETPNGPINLSAMRFNLENGKVRELAFEGLDTGTPKGPVKVGRFALKSLDIVGLMRMGALYSNPAKPPSPDQALGMLLLLEGVEVKNLAAPFKNSNRPITIDAINLDWGQFVGPIPSKARLTAKLTTPIDATDPKLKPLIASGINSAAIDLDLGAGWTEASRTFALELAPLELGGLLKASARLSLANVPREVFSPSPAQATAMAAQIEAGTLEFVLRDMGAVDLAIAQYARTQSIGRDAARLAIVDNIKASGAQAAASNPDTVAVVEALTRFVETPGQTLIIKLTPLGKVPALQLTHLLQTDPLIALAQFRIEASTGL